MEKTKNNKKFGYAFVLLVLLVGFINGMIAAFILVSYVDKINMEQNIRTRNIINEADYKIGLIRGCDIGCIDYDLTFHNKTWPSNEYILSDMYKNCSSFCTTFFD